MIEFTPEEQIIVNTLFEVGPTLQSPEGEQPITWTEIYSWKTVTQSPLEADDLSDLIEMSRAYMDGRSQGKNPLYVPPIDQFRETADPDWLDEND